MNSSLTRIFASIVAATLTAAGAYAQEKPAIPSKDEPSVKPATPPSYNGPYCSLLLQIPEQVAPGLYDVEVKSDRASFSTRRSVKVIDKFKDKFRIVHLSNMNVGDLTAPNFDEMLPREVNLLAPEFIIA